MDITTLLLCNQFLCFHILSSSVFLCYRRTLLPDCIIDHFCCDRIWLFSWIYRILMRGQWNRRRRVHWRGSLLKQATDVWHKKPIHIVPREEIISNTTAYKRILFFFPFSPRYKTSLCISAASKSMCYKQPSDINKTAWHFRSCI